MMAFISVDFPAPGAPVTPKQGGRFEGAATAAWSLSTAFRALAKANLSPRPAAARVSSSDISGVVLTVEFNQTSLTVLGMDEEELVPFF